MLQGMKGSMEGGMEPMLTEHYCTHRGYLRRLGTCHHWSFRHFQLSYRTPPTCHAVPLQHSGPKADAQEHHDLITDGGGSSGHVCG